MLPLALLMVAIEDEDDVHVTAEVKSCVSPLANVPIALNCTRIVLGTVGDCDVTWIELSDEDSTIKLAVPLTEPDFAVMVAVPADCPRATPAVLTVATLVEEEDHVTPEVSVCLVPSLNVPFATNCSVEPGATNPELGVSEMEVNIAVLTLT